MRPPRAGWACETGYKEQGKGSASPAKIIIQRTDWEEETARRLSIGGPAD